MLMIGEVPEAVGDITAWLGLVAVLLGVAAALWRPLRAGIATVVRDLIDPLKHTLDQLEAKLVDHMRVEEVRAADTHDQLARGTVALEQLAAATDQHGRRLTDVEEQVADHLAHHPGPGPKA